MLADRPHHNTKLQKSVRFGRKIFFIPDELHSFGVWTTYFEAEEALKIWATRYYARPSEWRSYCRARGWRSVEWL